MKTKKEKNIHMKKALLLLDFYNFELKVKKKKH